MPVLVVMFAVVVESFLIPGYTIQLQSIQRWLVFVFCTSPFTKDGSESTQSRRIGGEQAPL